MFSKVSNRSIVCIVAILMVTILAFPLIALPSPASAATWSSPVTIDAEFGLDSAALEIGRNFYYAMAWQYVDGPVYLYKSIDQGTTWSSGMDVFGMGLYDGFPGMCTFSNGTNDQIIIASGPNLISRSMDNGNSFQRLTDLPLSTWAAWNRLLCPATNASWFGTTDIDSDIYVVGTWYKGEPWEGYQVVAITKSTDNGTSWSDPVIINDDPYCDSVSAEIISDGRTLYVTYTIYDPYAGAYKDLYMRYSNDWGSTWSDQILLKSRTLLALYPFSFQYLDENRALLVTEDVASPDVSISVAHYGYFWFSNMTFQEIGNMTGPEWGFYLTGMSGKLDDSNVLNLVWVDSTDLYGYNYILKFAKSYDSGLTKEMQVSNEHLIVKGAGGPNANAVTWEYRTGKDPGIWKGHIVNNGLRSLVVDVFDVTSGTPIEILHQRIRFAAYPTDIVDTNVALLGAQRIYSITVTPNGPRDSSATITEPFIVMQPPVASFYVISNVNGVVSVDASASYDPDGTIVEYDWDWGDGTIGTGVVATHTYAAYGLYVITLTVVDNMSLRDSMSMSP